MDLKVESTIKSLCLKAHDLWLRKSYFWISLANLCNDSYWNDLFNAFGWLLPSFALGISFWGTGGHLDPSKFKSRTWVDYLFVSVVRYPRIPTSADISRPFWCRYSQRENISSTLEVHWWRTSTLRIIFFPECPWWWTQWLSFKPCIDYGAEGSGWTPSWYTFTAQISILGRMQTLHSFPRSQRLHDAVVRKDLTSRSWSSIWDQEVSK